MKIEQSKNELKQHLREQINFIKKSSTDYDEGDISEAKRIATSIRLLLHDTKHSNSLLSIIQQKGIVLFQDTAMPMYPGNRAPYFGLVFIRITSNGTDRFEPLLNDLALINMDITKPFDAWWGGCVIKDLYNKEFTRKDLVLYVADTDGGAHVDKGLREDYYNLSRKNSLGLSIVEKHGEQQKEEELKYIALASIRQIAFEILSTLNRYSLI